MAHEITNRDGLVLTGEPAWHGLGIVVQKAPSPAEALQIAHLDWDVEQNLLTMARKIVTVGVEGVSERTENVPVPSHVANVRQDTQEILGVVGSGYGVVQNRDLVGLIYEAAKNEGVTVESAGSLRGGKNVFFLCHLGTFQIESKDRLHQYALVANSHDGTRALTVSPTDIRVVCANTRAAALAVADKARLTVSIPHRSEIMSKIGDVRKALGVAVEVAVREAERAKALAERQMSPEEVQTYFIKVYERLYGGMPLEPKTQGERSKRTRADKAISTWVKTFRREQDEVGLTSSAWLAANAVTEWVDHDRQTKGGDRTYSNLLGSAAQAKSEGFAEAMALVSA